MEIKTITPTATNLFDFDGTEVEVCVTLDDGWSVEFGLNSTYLYDGNKHGYEDAIAYGVYTTAGEYDEYMDESSEYESCKEVEDGVILNVDETLTRYIIDLGDEVYYMLMITELSQTQEIRDRFDVTVFTWE